MPPPRRVRIQVHVKCAWRPRWSTVHVISRKAVEISGWRWEQMAAGLYQVSVKMLLIIMLVAVYSQSAYYSDSVESLEGICWALLPLSPSRVSSSPNPEQGGSWTGSLEVPPPPSALSHPPTHAWRRGGDVDQRERTQKRLICCWF